MRKRRSTPRALLAGAIVVAIVAGAGYAFTASNTVPGSNAGYGTSVVSGYTVSAITYHLDGTDPTKSDYAQFTVTPDSAGIAPTTVKAKPGAADTVYTGCTNPAGTTWKCTWAAPVVVASIDALQVVAVQ